MSFARKTVLSSIVAAIALAINPSAHATVTQTGAGVSGNAVPVSFLADFTITGDNLALTIYNNSAKSLNPSDVLSSFYFDIVNGSSQRPTLTYQSAYGDVWMTDKNSADTLQTSAGNLKALLANDNTWQFKVMNAAFNPFGGFGVGTVGNSSLGGNSFNGNITGALDYSIYAGDVTTQNLTGKRMVKDHITFNFTGLTGFTENDIATTSAFGLGTAPDSILGSTPPPAVPEPASLGCVGLIGLTLGRRRRSA